MTTTYRQSKSAIFMKTCLLLALAFTMLSSATSGVFAQTSDGPLTPINILERGHYCVESAGVDLYQSGSGSFDIDLRGNPAAVHLFWSGRYNAITTGGDSEIAVEISHPSGLAAEFAVTADQSRNHPIKAERSELQWYTYHQNLTQSIVETGVLAGGDGVAKINVSGLKTDPNAPGNSNEGHGMGLIVVYENESCPLSSVTIQYGLDGFYYARQAPYGPNSEVACTEFDATTEGERQMAVHMFVGGVEAYQDGGHRPNSIVYVTGNGDLPNELVTNAQAGATAVPYTQTEQRPYPLVADEGEFDTFQSEVQIPAGSQYACFQIESTPQNDPAGISAVWMGLATQISLPEPPRPALIANKSRVVSWVYNVMNRGTEMVDQVALNAGTGVAVDCKSQTTIVPAGSISCSAQGNYQNYRNVSFVGAQTVAGQGSMPVTLVQDWLSPNLRSAVHTEVLLNNAFAHVPPGVYAQAGDELAVQVRITNIGDYPLNLTSISMTQLSNGSAAAVEGMLSWTCLDAPILQVGESKICSASILAQAGPSASSVSVQAEPILPLGDLPMPGVIDTVSAYHVGY